MLVGRQITVLKLEVFRVFAHPRQHGAQIVEIEQQQTVVIGDLEGCVQHAGLRVVQAEQPRQQQRSHLGDRDADRHTGLAEQVPQRQRKTIEAKIRDADFLNAFVDTRHWLARVPRVRSDRLSHRR